MYESLYITNDRSLYLTIVYHKLWETRKETAQDGNYNVKARGFSRDFPNHRGKPPQVDRLETKCPSVPEWMKQLRTQV
jgi:hypothetical protein